MTERVSNSHESNPNSGLLTPDEALERPRPRSQPIDRLRGLIADFMYAESSGGSVLPNELSRHTSETSPDYMQARDVLQATLHEIPVLEPDRAREVVGLAHQINSRALDNGDESLTSPFNELKTAVYGTAEVDPLPTVVHELAVFNEQRARDLAPNYLVKPTGATIQIETLDPGSVLGQKTPNSTIRLTPGPQDVWLIQIGTQAPILFDDDGLRPQIPAWDIAGREAQDAAGDESLIIGRQLLDGPTAIARQHTRLDRTPEGINITDMSSSQTSPGARTRVIISGEFPDPVEFRAQRDVVTRDQRVSQIRDQMSSL